MKFKQLAEKWLETVYISHSIVTYNRYYQTLIWYLYPEFENFQIHKIKQQQFADFYIKMQTRISKITHRPYSESTLSSIHTILYEIMKFGRDKLKLHCLVPEFVKIRRDFESNEPVLFFQDKELGKVVLQLYKMREEIVSPLNLTKFKESLKAGCNFYITVNLICNYIYFRIIFNNNII